MKKEKLQDYPFTSHYLQLGDNNLHYLDEGQGPVMLLLHGNPTWSYLWRKIILHFRQHFRVIAPDHMGMGLSDRPHNYSYTLSQHMENTKKLMDFLELKNIHLAVHDWGGAIGFGLATKEPERFSSFVVFNSAAFLSKHLPKRIALCKIPFIGKNIVKYFNAFLGPALFMGVTRTLTSNEKKAYTYPYQNASSREAIAEFVQDIPMNPKHRSYKTLKNIDDNLSLLQKPLCLIWGAEDFCFNDHFYHEWIKRFPNANKHYLIGAGHWVMEDQPEEVITLMEQFYHGQYR